MFVEYYIKRFQYGMRYQCTYEVENLYVWKILY